MFCPRLDSFLFQYEISCEGKKVFLGHLRVFSTNSKLPPTLQRQHFLFSLFTDCNEEREIFSEYAIDNEAQIHSFKRGMFWMRMKLRQQDFRMNPTHIKAKIVDKLKTVL